MKCQKCSKPAVVHLTEVINEAGGAKHAVEIHLCLGHAAEAGLIAPGSELLPQILAGNPVPPPAPKKSAPNQSTSDSGLETAIVPAPAAPGGGIVVARDKSGQPDPAACPLCGMAWAQFKQSGLMGCPHDYEFFDAKVVPLLKRAQEGAAEHVGKVPAARKNADTDRQLNSLRLRKELQRAIDAEQYEKAAQLRDALRKLEQN